jgi:hypothetical protein
MKIGTDGLGAVAIAVWMSMPIGCGSLQRLRQSAFETSKKGRTGVSPRIDEGGLLIGSVIW